MGSNGFLRVSAIMSADFTNNNTKVVRFRFGGQLVNAFDIVDARSWSKQINIWNTNTPTGQIAGAGTNVAIVSYGSLQGPMFNGSVNTAIDQPLICTVSNGVATDSLNLESFMVTMMPFNRPALTESTPVYGPNMTIAGVLSQFSDGYRPLIVNTTPTTAPALSLAENTVFSGTIPGGSMASNGTLRVTFMTDQTSNGNLKYMTVRYGGEIVRQWATSLTTHWMGSFTMSNRASLTNQISGGISSAAVSFSQTGMLPVNIFVDSSVDQSLICTVSNSLATDTITGRAFIVECERAN